LKNLCSSLSLSKILRRPYDVFFDNELILKLILNRLRIAEKEGLVAEELVLIHGLTTLEDEEDLQVYGIQEGKTPL
jgi:hypothetical protein